MILIITRRDDFTADFMIQRLIEREIEYHRFDVDFYLRDVAVEAEFRNGKLIGEITTPQGAASFDSIKSVWYRRAMNPDLAHLKMSPGDHHFARQEAAHFLQGTLGSLPAKWVNRWCDVTRWERKLSQLRLAVSCGLGIPHTLVSTDIDHLRNFVSQRQTVGKTLSWGVVATEAGFESVYTHSIGVDDLGQQGQADLCPTLLQEQVAKTGDVRLTVIGDRCFAAYLESDTDDGIDWRRPGTPVRYAEIDVPERIHEGIRQFMERTGLVYGAFDFAIAEEGGWVFLEVNPAGEFGWIEKELGWPLRDALIDELLIAEAMD